MQEEAAPQPPAQHCPAQSEPPCQPGSGLLDGGVATRGSGMQRPGGWERSPFLLQLLLWLHTRTLAAPGKRQPLLSPPALPMELQSSCLPSSAPAGLQSVYPSFPPLSLYTSFPSLSLPLFPSSHSILSFPSLYPSFPSLHRRGERERKLGDECGKVCSQWDLLRRKGTRNSSSLGTFTREEVPLRSIELLRLCTDVGRPSVQLGERGGQGLQSFPHLLESTSH